ncbi:helix-turn-helix domain-containing protein [Solemya velum gill symbiont]|uniref:helix-turn-helix domain-containing protein n=1 Tax=Solemya velum gill symbiont TaxID=2340 RepID=UPI0018A82586
MVEGATGRVGASPNNRDEAFTNYSQLTEYEVYQIYALKKGGHSQKDIAGLLGRNPSSISCELRRNKGLRGYRPKQAQRLSDFLR